MVESPECPPFKSDFLSCGQQLKPNMVTIAFVAIGAAGRYVGQSLERMGTTVFYVDNVPQDIQNKDVFEKDGIQFTMNFKEDSHEYCPFEIIEPVQYGPDLIACAWLFNSKSKATDIKTLLKSHERK